MNLIKSLKVKQYSGVLKGKRHQRRFCLCPFVPRQEIDFFRGSLRYLCSSAIHSLLVLIRFLRALFIFHLLQQVKAKEFSSCCPKLASHSDALKSPSVSSASTKFPITLLQFSFSLRLSTSASCRPTHVALWTVKIEFGPARTRSKILRSAHFNFYQFLRSACRRVYTNTELPPIF